MNYVRNIFVVLTYINSADLIDFIASVRENVNDFKIIIVNSFHDDGSKKAIEQIAKDNNCDFINLENKGYSYGNNYGIAYALQHYKFDFLTVSNADIIVNKYNTNELPSKGIFAGVIIARDGRAQNPMIVHEYKLREKLCYEAFKKKQKWKLLFAVGMNKIDRTLFLIMHRNIGRDAKNKLRMIKVYQGHGSFITFSRLTLEMLWNGKDVNFKGIFDENMFLFAEESVLAKRAEKLGIPIFFSNFAICNHKEDGSMNLSNIDVNGELAKSNIYFYEHYCY